MVRSSSPLRALQQFRRRAAAWFDDDEYATVKLVVAITLVALALRLVSLGYRTAHFDEGRVAYWAWHFGETGNFAYRYIIHGPFIQHADRWLFDIIGPSDFAMRLPIAVVGGLLPLTALLLRAHLDRTEVVALALLLTLDPVLLYFSRFMRSDMLVAAFMFTAFAFLVRLYDTRKARYLYAAAVFLALGFASKENALVYVLTWLGATGLLLAKVLVLPKGFREAADFLVGPPSIRALRARVRNDVDSDGPLLDPAGPREIRDRLVGGVKARIGLVVGIVRGFRRRHEAALLTAGSYVGHVVLAVLLFGFVSLFFYAPRGAGVEGLRHPPAAATAQGYVGFWEGITNPALFGDLLETTTDRVVEQWGNWLEPGQEKTRDSYEKHFWISTEALVLGSRAVAALAGVGYLLDRVGFTRPRHLIPFCFYAGFVSIFGYPLGTDIGAPWLATHMVVPLAVPAAVALAVLLRWASSSLAAGDWDGFGSATLVLFVVCVLLAQSAAGQVYTNTTEDENPLVQYAQPEAELKGSLEEMDRLATAHNGSIDVLVYYGETGAQHDEFNGYVGPRRSNWGDSYWNNRPTCMMWYNSLPLPWYFAAGDMDVRCENDERNLDAIVAQEPPPVVITQSFDETVPAQRLSAAGYDGETHRMRTTGQRNDFVVWTNEDAVNETAR